MVEPQGNRGGFSGAALWRVKQPGGDLCLRAGPLGDMDRRRHTDIHYLMKLARDKGLLFVPAVFTSDNGSTSVVHADRLWELTTWMPGAATTPAKVRSEQAEGAFAALALLHSAWTPVAPSRGQCPGLIRRLEAFREWEKLIQTGWRLSRDSADPAYIWAERACLHLEAQANQIPHKLEPWLGHQMALQPCLCDIWHDHVLFEGNLVTGLVDFGGIKTDHVAVDLARLLGRLVEDRAEFLAAGL